MAFRPRDFVNDEDDDDFDSFWWTTNGEIVRWSIFAGIILAAILFMAIGHWHAKRRIRRGLPPLAYHRWLLTRQQRATYDPSYREPVPTYGVYRPNEYGMNAYPPPVYDPNSQQPPKYEPAVGVAKIDPSQWRAAPTRRPESGEAAPDYTAPPGPPPSALGRGPSGSINEFANQYRI